MKCVWWDFGSKFSWFFSPFLKIMRLLSTNASVPCCHISQWKEHAKLVYKNMGLVSASFRNFDFWSLEGEQLEKEAKFGQKTELTHSPSAQIFNWMPNLENLDNFALANFYRCQKLDQICLNQAFRHMSLFCSFLPADPKVGLIQPIFYSTYESQWRLPMGWGAWGRSKCDPRGS